MKYFTLILVAIFSTSLYSQECALDEWIEEEYFCDAQRLALREIASDNDHEFQDSIFIPQSITNKYLGIISSVYFQNTDLTNTIFNYYSIHAFPDLRYPWNNPYSQITLHVDTNYTWVNAYIQDSLVSGNVKFDSITSIYDFKLLHVMYLTSSIFVYIGSFDVLHLEPLVSPFESINGIISANTENPWIGDGNDIEITFSNDTSFIVFSLGWGDCPAGCDNRHYWEYSVFNCISTYENSYGDPLPSGFDNSSVDDMMIFPNPIEDKIFIKNSTGEKLTIQVYTLKGELVLRQQIRSNSIDLSELNSGMYFLTIWSDKKRETIKILKP